MFTDSEGRRRMWFGNRNYMQWVVCPTIDTEITSSGWNSRTDYLNGGAYLRSSVGTHKEYALDWGLTERAEIRKITDYADGIYGQDLIHLVDPFAADANVLPMHYAAPFQGGYDGSILDGTDVPPVIVPGSSVTLGYPMESAQYSLSGISGMGLWVPIPPGYTFWFGAHGQGGAGGGVFVAPTTGPLAEGAPVEMNVLSTSSTTRVDYSLDSTEASGAMIRLGGTGTIILSGMIAQILPTGVTPEEGGFISGQGNSGCRFDGYPEVEAYSAAMDKVGCVANLIEVGSWL